MTVCVVPMLTLLPGAASASTEFNECDLDETGTIDEAEYVMPGPGRAGE